MDDRRAIFIFFLLCSVSSSTVCFFTASKLNVHAPSPLLCFCSVFATYRLEYELQRVEAFTMDPFGRKYSWNNSEKDWVKKDCFGTCDMVWEEDASSSSQNQRSNIHTSTSGRTGGVKHETCHVAAQCSSVGAFPQTVLLLLVKAQHFLIVLLQNKSF